MRRRRSIWLVATVLLAAGCAADAPQDTLEGEGPAAADIDSIFNLALVLATIVFVLVFAAIIYIAIRFRRRGTDDDEELPTQIQGNTKLEIGWTVAPAALLAVLAIPTVALIFDLQDRAENARMVINVTGQQWWWEFEYPEEGIVTANDLVIPVNTNIRLNIESRDVIHSFWIPRLNGKRDAVPGRTHLLSIEADQPGIYFGQCTEFCGLAHADMRARAIALTDADWKGVGRIAAGECRRARCWCTRSRTARIRSLRAELRRVPRHQRCVRGRR